MEESVFREETPVDANTEILAGGGDPAQTELATNPQEDYSQYMIEVDKVYRQVQRATYNALPKTNKLAPTDSPILYANPVRWHPSTQGANAGMRVNNVAVRHVGATNIYRKMQY